MPDTKCEIIVSEDMNMQTGSKTSPIKTSLQQRYRRIKYSYPTSLIYSWELLLKIISENILQQNHAGNLIPPPAQGPNLCQDKS